MPTYLYQCPNCKRTLEISRQVRDRDYVATCEECLPEKYGRFKMKRIIAKTNFILKGSGWAKDGYDK